MKFSSSYLRMSLEFIYPVYGWTLVTGFLISNKGLTITLLGFGFHIDSWTKEEQESLDKITARVTEYIKKLKDK